MKRISHPLILFFFIVSLFVVREATLSRFIFAQTKGTCSPPADYRGCSSSSFGTNGVALMDSQYAPIETDFAKLRDLANQSSPGAAAQRLQATIILGDGTIADHDRTLAIFRNAEKYGIDMTIRTWGNDIPTDVAQKMGSNLSTLVKEYQNESGNAIRVELGNEPNLDTNGTNYARAFAAFAQTCTNCSVYLPSMGGTSMADKEQFIKDFTANSAAVKLAREADGIVFNSYADTPREAVSDWVNTVALWEKAGIDTSQKRFFLTEIGPSIPEPDRPNLDQFLAGVAQEFKNIKNNPNDPLYKYFQKLDGLTYFIWDKNQKLYLYYVDEKGNVRKSLSLPSANVPGQIPLDSGTNTPPASRTEPAKNLEDEYTATCWREEYVGQIRENGAPFYRTFDGKLEREMRADGNFNWNGATGKFGGYCGVVKSDPILLRETAYYGLKEIPQCKKAEWMGEIQLNYDNPAAESGMPIAVPFAQEIANQLEGDWSAPFVSESEIEAKSKLALDAETTGTLNSVRAKAISEIQRREGVLKKILSTQKQDELKCDMVEYVQYKGKASIYTGFTIYGRSISSVVCPPNVTKPATFTSAERAAWEKQWGKIWSKLPLFPNETTIGDWMFSVCDDRIYHNTQKVKEVMRMGLAVNALWQALTPLNDQEKLYKNGYEDLRRPLKSKLLLGTTPKGRSIQPNQLTPPAPSYLANKSMTELAKIADKDPECKAKETPRPNHDNGRCMHFVPTGQYDDSTLNTNVARMKDLGVTWTLALYDDENVLARAAKAFGEAGIMPVWRKQLKIDQAPSGYAWGRDIEIMKRYGNDDINKNGPLIQLYNEPGDDREWSNGSPNFSVYLNNFTAMSQRIMAAGGRVGVQLQDAGELAALIAKIQSDKTIDQKAYWDRIFFIPHLYANGNPSNWANDEIGALGFRQYAEVFQKELGFVPPMIVGEGGPEIKEHPNDNPKVTQDMHAQYVADIYNQFTSGKMTDGRPLPDYLLAFCNWIIDSLGETRFQNYAWYNNLTVAGDLTKTINMVKSLPDTERTFSCDKPTTMIPPKKSISLLQKFLSLVRTNATVLAATIDRVPVINQVGRLLAQNNVDCGNVLEANIEGTPGSPDYSVTIGRTACGKQKYPGPMGHIRIFQEKDVGGNGQVHDFYLGGCAPDKSQCEVARFTPGMLPAILPQLKTVEDFQKFCAQGFLQVRADSFNEAPHSVNCGISPPTPAGGPGGGGTCDTALQCCETATCNFTMPRSSQLGPSETGGNFGSSTYSADHVIIGVDWSGTVGGGMPLAKPVQLIWKVPGWKKGERPLPPDCQIVTDNKSPACGGPGDDGSCGAGYDACDEHKLKCGVIICTKVHDRVVDVYNSVPFLDSAWKQLAGAADKTYGAGVLTMFKPTTIKGTKKQPPESGCTMDPAVVFDEKGNFTPVPGAGLVTYSFDQGFGVGAAERSIAEYNGFGKSQVKVEQILPTDGKRSKVLFYRLGGLCNAAFWMSRKVAGPIALRGSAGGSDTSIVGKPIPGSFGTVGSQPEVRTSYPDVPLGSSAAPITQPAVTEPVPPAQAQTIAAQVAALVPSAPQNETPKVTTVTDQQSAKQTVCPTQVAVGDKVVTYVGSKQIIVYRPSTNSIVCQPPLLQFAIRNGSGSLEALDTYANDLMIKMPNVLVIEKKDAVAKNYAQTFIVDVSGYRTDERNALAIQLGIQVGTLPEGESKPDGALFLIILGSDWEK